MDIDVKKLLKLEDVIEITGITKPTIYRAIKRGEFPRPLKISLRRVAWKQEDIQAWSDGLNSATYKGDEEQGDNYPEGVQGCKETSTNC